MNTPPPQEVSHFQAQYNKFIRLGFFVCGAFFVIIFLSATLIRISGAVTATGTVVQTGENKLVQHPTGGPVGKILVQNGDTVNKGDALIVLDSAAIEAQHQVLKQRKLELEIMLQRLAAMDNEQDNFQIDRSQYPANNDIIDTQEAVFIAQKNRLHTAEQQLVVRINGLETEQNALKKQLTTNQKQLKFLNESINELSRLYKKQLISKSRLINLERERVTVLTQIESLHVSQVQLQNNYNEAVRSLESLRKENKEQIWQQIEASKTELIEVSNNLTSTTDQQARLVISAPEDGRIHELAVKNINAVIQPGDVIGKIVPISESFIIHSRVTPMDIEQLYLGQETRIRFDTFDAQKTPEIKGEVLTISPDSTLDKDTGETYFLVKVSLENSEAEKITTGEITSGLPVSTWFTTNERTIMNYLLKPLKEQLFRAFREG